MADPRDDARSVIGDPRAPADERRDAQAEFDKPYAPLRSQLIPAEDISPVIALIQEGLEEEELAKARGSIIQFPRQKAKQAIGRQSVQLDEQQALISGDWYERPNGLNFASLRAMVEQTPILSAVVMTRIRQVSRFCAPSEDGGIGYEIRQLTKDKKPSAADKTQMQQLQRFVANCGWEFNPRMRKALKRDSFSTMMAKLTRDSLTMDSAPIECELRRNKSLGIDGLYSVDGSTIRLCTEDGYEGNDEIYAVQIVAGNVACGYTRDQLIYEPRNPRADIRLGGYGLGETELLVKTVTAYLNAMSYNSDFFDKSSIPKGLLQLSGDYGESDMAAFRRHWNSMVKGVENKWSLPVLVSKDGEGKANFIDFKSTADEMAYAKWVSFLTSIVCAVYGIDAEEIGFEGFTAEKSSLSGSDTGEKIISSHDKGLRPLLAYFEALISDYVISAFDPDLCFRWTGLDEEDKAKSWEARKLILTVDEMRAEHGYGAFPDPLLGQAPVNRDLIAPWAQLHLPAAAQASPESGDQTDGDFGKAPGDPSTKTDFGSKPDFGKKAE